MMMRTTLLAAALAIATLSAGCGEQNRTTDRAAANPQVPPTTPSAPPKSAASGPAATTPTAPTPETHAGTPQTTAPPVAGAQDSTANRPQSDLTKSEEQHSMPKSGQVNNYNSPAYEPKQGAGGNDAGKR